MSLGLVASLLDLYGYLIVAYVILSWFVATNRSGLMADVYRVLASICEPYVGLFRRLVPPIQTGSSALDLSPLIALVVLQIVAGFMRRAG
jgi:YggT family protein